MVERDRTTRARYLVARDRGGRLVGALPCYRWSGRRAPALDHYDPHAMGGRWLLGDRSPADEWRPTLFVGTRSGYMNDWPIHPDWRHRRHDLAASLLHAAFRFGADSGCASMGAMWLTTDAARDVCAARAGPRRLLLGAGSARLDVPWTTFDGYLASLSPSRRHTVRRELRRFGESGLHLAEARLSECCDVLGALSAPLQARYGHALSAAELAQQFRQLAAELDHHSRVLLCTRDGRPVGFTLFVGWQGTWYGRAAGFDYEAVRGSAAYFTLAFYRPIALAIAEGVSRIHLGLAAWEAKVLRGARLEPHWLWIVPPARWRGSWPRRVSHQVAHARGWWQERFRTLCGELPASEWDPGTWDGLGGAGR